MKIEIKRKAMQQLIKNLQNCLKTKSSFVVEDTLDGTTVSFVNIKMEEGEHIFKEKDVIYTKSRLKESNWYKE